MEWKKSTLSGAELERKRKEYIEAAMKMSDRAQPAPENEHDILKKEAEEIVFAEPEAPAQKEETENPNPAPKEETEAPNPAPKEETETPNPAPKEEEELFQPELLHEPEPIGETEKNYGVFDVDELIEAVKKGEVDGEKLREASEILEGMSGKTEEMQKLAGQPASLNQSVQRHNGGSCPHCGQGNRNGNRR